MLISIETHITCDFPGGGGVRIPLPPSGSAIGKKAAIENDEKVQLWVCRAYFADHVFTTYPPFN